MEQQCLFPYCVLLLLTLQFLFISALVVDSCINIKHCPAAVKYLNDIQTNEIHNSDVQVLKNAYCGSTGRQTNVRCEEIPSCYQPSDPNYCVKAKDCCVALRLTKLNGTENDYVKQKLKESVCSTRGSEIKVKCSSLLEIEEALLKNVPADKNFCVTPSGVKGQCVPWQTCPTFMGKPTGRNYQDYLQRSICDRPSKRVCCGVEENIDNVCGLDNSQRNYIAGGTATEPNEFPWVVLLKYTDPKIVCGGDLINSQFVLTAGHCVKTDLIKIKIAGNFPGDQDTKLLEYDILSKETHPNYRLSPIRFDIALLRIQKVSYSDHIRWICLPPASNIQLPNNYLIVGSGATENGTQSTKQLKAPVPKGDPSKCAELYRNYLDSYYDYIICAGGEPGVDACPGDSGGPLMAKSSQTFWQLYGIVSGGQRDCSNGTPAFYTRVDKFLDWIHMIMKKML